MQRRMEKIFANTAKLIFLLIQNAHLKFIINCQHLKTENEWFYLIQELNKVQNRSNTSQGR